ncbi:hypothetical protein AAF712_011027 [Marasmius tenuissimus]|uniref:Uncharacterized protein n=1 Tax=Marasmius tenuissimus TaxID=585030 RepID=A0ABR2ZKB2_9AGAR
MVNTVLANSSRRFTARLLERSGPTSQRVTGSAAGASGRYAQTRQYTSSRHENDPHTLETEKQRNLKGTQDQTSTPHKKHAPGWNEHLASDSEASGEGVFCLLNNLFLAHAVRSQADRDGDGPSAKETIEQVHSRHNPDAPTEAKSDKEEVKGPLSKAS